jgi:hypothetical protein
MWPAVQETTALLERLVTGKSAADPNNLQRECLALRDRVGGASLSGWVAQALAKQSKSKPPPVSSDFESPDSLTGTFPAGALATAMAAARPPIEHEEPAADSQKTDGGDKPDELDQMLRALAEHQKTNPTPIPTSAPERSIKTSKRRRSSTPPAWALALLFGGALLLAVGLGLALVAWAP